MMQRVTVTQIFFDKNSPGKKYFPGDVVEFSKERASELIAKGVAVADGRAYTTKKEEAEPAEEKKVAKKVQEPIDEVE